MGLFLCLSNCSEHVVLIIDAFCMPSSRYINHALANQSFFLMAAGNQPRGVSPNDQVAGGIAEQEHCYNTLDHFAGLQIQPQAVEPGMYDRVDHTNSRVKGKVGVIIAVNFKWHNNNMVAYSFVMVACLALSGIHVVVGTGIFLKYTHHCGGKSRETG